MSKVYRRGTVDKERDLRVDNIMVLLQGLSLEEAKKTLDKVSNEIHDKAVVSSKGFTLVELAIILTIIGLVLGGILKVKEISNEQGHPSNQPTVTIIK
jgi:hypothetical protein